MSPWLPSHLEGFKTTKAMHVLENIPVLTFDSDPGLRLGVAS